MVTHSTSLDNSMIEALSGIQAIGVTKGLDTTE